MSLSDRDLELAKKHCADIGFVNFEGLAAFLAERDQLAIKEKDDAVREALSLARNLCIEVNESAFNASNSSDVAWYDTYSYISGYRDAAIDCDEAIRALIEPKT